MSPHDIFWTVIERNYPISVEGMRLSERHSAGPVDLIAYARCPLPEHAGVLRELPRFDPWTKTEYE